MIFVFVCLWCNAVDPRPCFGQRYYTPQLYKPPVLLISFKDISTSFRIMVSLNLLIMKKIKLLAIAAFVFCSVIRANSTCCSE